MQSVCGAVHVLPEQLGCAMPPHDSQMPLVQTCCVLPMLAQAEPVPTHLGVAVPVVVVSQQPFVHRSPGQHG